jgi:Glycosyltransferase family 87
VDILLDMGFRVTRKTDVRLWMALAYLVLASAIVLTLIPVQRPGIDFLPLWAGGGLAQSDLTKLYDFAYLTGLQGWPLGPDYPRPFVYPPTALFVFAPLSYLPWPVAYAGFMALTAALYLWAGRRAGVPSWFMLVPWVTFAAYCGQATFLIGGLILLAVAERERRPILAGLLLAVVGTFKPQILILLPVALAAERRWTVFIATGLGAAAIVLGATLIFGLELWVAWFNSLPEFARLVAGTPGLVRNSISPYVALQHLGLDGRWAFLLFPPVAAWVWFTFRRPSDLAERWAALIGGAFLVSPYAMHYELALLAPMTALYLARTFDRRWIAYLVLAVGQFVLMSPALLNLLAALAPAAISRVSAQRDQRVDVEPR